MVSLNAIMVDGTGMCGGCRVTVGGETRYACVDGPEFDAHEVDFGVLADRLTTYRPFEEAAVQRRSACLLPGLAEHADQAVEGARSMSERPGYNPRERMALERTGMPAQDPDVRAKSFTEVNLGFSHVLAAAEAERCLQCKNPLCIEGCPVRVNIPRFIDLVAEGDLARRGGIAAR